MQESHHITSLFKKPYSQGASVKLGRDIVLLCYLRLCENIEISSKQMKTLSTGKAIFDELMTSIFPAILIGGAAGCRSGGAE